MQGPDPFIELIPIAAATGARKELYDDLERVRGKGHVSNLFKAYGAFPELGIANFKRLTVLLSQGTLSTKLKEAVMTALAVINHCDYNQTNTATIALSNHTGPAYLRFGRPKWPIFTDKNIEFIIGKAIKFIEGKDVSIFATGHMLWQALEAEKELFDLGISSEIINIHTIKPLDTKSILKSVSKTKCVVTCEEHNVIGGLGESIASILSEKLPCPIKLVGVKDSFGESGRPLELLDKYKLTPDSIKKAAISVIEKK